LSAQVGIRTEDPQGMLYVDAKSNTNGSQNASDDVAFTSEGGGKAPTSDASGRTTWITGANSGAGANWADQVWLPFAYTGTYRVPVTGGDELRIIPVRGTNIRTPSCRLNLQNS
jgi:hypothetical protein